MLFNTSWDVDNCVIDTLVECMVVLLSHTSAYMVLLIGYDRYYRMRYLTRYAEVVKHWYLKVTIHLKTVPLSDTLAPTPC